MTFMEKNLVILHGWQSKIIRWKRLKDELEKRGWSVFLPNLPGFGSAELVKPWALSDYVDWLIRFAKKKKLKSFSLLGHSFGGRIALKFSSRNPKQLEKLILVNSAGIRRKLSLKRTLFLILAKIGRAIFLLPPFSFFKKPARWLLYTLAREKDYFKADKLMRKTMKKVLGEDLQSILSKIRTETLIVWGRQDRITPIADGRFLKKLIPNSQLIVYNNAGHSLPFDNAVPLAEEINSFLLK